MGLTAPVTGNTLKAPETVFCSLPDSSGVPISSLQPATILYKPEPQPEIPRSTQNLDPEAPDVKPNTSIPESGCWIIFPVKQDQLVTVGWWKAMDVWEEAEYYKIPCYWSVDESFTIHTPRKYFLISLEAQEFDSCGFHI